jgi:hypothetical protein
MSARRRNAPTAAIYEPLDAAWMAVRLSKHSIDASDSVVADRIESLAIGLNGVGQVAEAVDLSSP